jgi:hypothetical protein
MASPWAKDFSSSTEIQMQRIQTASAAGFKLRQKPAVLCGKQLKVWHRLCSFERRNSAQPAYKTGVNKIQ